MDFINDLITGDRLEPAPSVLYVVGTPIGNLGDLSPRAKFIIKNVSLIACEDTRRSSQLLKSIGAKTNLLSFHKHNTKSRIPELIALLKQGQSIALISDAGLPGISDPGEELVVEAKKSNFEVICIPGPCAATTALLASGLPSRRFCFEGFLPTKSKDRKESLEYIAQETRTIIIYESPHKLIKLLEELSERCEEDRPIYVLRELTKLHEECIGATIKSVLDHFSNKKPKGELTIILGGTKLNKHKQISNSELINKMKQLLDNNISASEAARKISNETGYSRRILYSLLHQSLLINKHKKKI